MANEIKVADTKAQQVAVKINNELTSIMTSSNSWKLFIDKFSQTTQKEIMFDVYTYVNKHTDVVSKMEANAFMSCVVECYSKGFTLKDGDSYILPFKKSIKNEETGKYESIYVPTHVPGYQGVVRLATQSGLFKHFDCVPVIKESIASFDYRRNVPIFNNTYIPNGTEKVIGYLASSLTHDGMEREIYHPVEYFKDFALRKSLQCIAAKKLVGGWETDFDAMCKKTGLKELGKLAPKTANPTIEQSQFFNYLENDSEENETLLPQPETYKNTDLIEEDLSGTPFAEQIVETPKKTVKTENTSELKCEECGAVIEDRVYAYSKEKYGKALCYNCQKKHKKG